MKKKITIIGSGATGVAMLIALIHSDIDADIDLIDPIEPGIGKAFNHASDLMICNTSSDTMSISTREPNDFINYLKNCGINIQYGYFSPRYIYRNYISHKYLEIKKDSDRKSIRVTYRKEKAKHITYTKNGCYTISTMDGSNIPADYIVLATGMGESNIPSSLKPCMGHPFFHLSPYVNNAYCDISDDLNILIIGSKLSAIDAIVMLARKNCHINMISPSGALPAVRTATPMMMERLVKATDLQSLDLQSPQLEKRIYQIICKKLIRASFPPLSRQISRSPSVTQRFLEEINIAEKGINHWQRLIVESVDAMNESLTDTLGLFRLPMQRLSAN